MNGNFVDHLWQSTLFAAAVAMLAFVCRGNRAAVRHSLWMAASLKFLIPFSLLVWAGSRTEAIAPVALPTIQSIPHAVEQLAYPSFSVATPTGAIRFPWEDLLFALWACGATAIAGRYLQKFLQVRAIVRTGVPLDIGCAVPVLSTTSVFEPGAYGIRRPVILLPSGIEDSLPENQLRAILTHEVAHIRRRDNLSALLHMLVETVFWFHPLVWWISARLVEERERACDEEVVRQGSEPGVYAESILNVCKAYVESPVRCVSGVTGSDLKQRITTIMTNPAILRLQLTKKLLLAAAALVASCVPFFAGMVYAQSRSFEVASIRPSDPNRVRINDGKTKGGEATGGGAPLMRFDGGRFENTGTAMDFILRGYEVHTCSFPFRRDGSCELIIGGPDWVRKESYDIIAKIPAGTPDFEAFDYIRGDAKPLYAMLKELLAERFQLKSHYETREIPVYAIVVAKGGPKLAKSAGKMATTPGGREFKDTSFMFGPGGNANGEPQVKMVVRAHSMDLLATDMSNIMDRPVVNRTGIEGEFDMVAVYPLDVGAGTATELRGPGLFTAFQEQLGLRLEATKAPMQVLIIDSIERPSEN